MSPLPLAQRSSYSLRLVGVCALCAIGYVSNVAPCAIKSSHHLVICTSYYISRSFPCVGHGKFIRDIALGTSASFMGLLDILASGEIFPVVQAFTGPCYVGHTSWPEHAYSHLFNRLVSTEASCPVLFVFLGSQWCPLCVMRNSLCISHRAMRDSSPCVGHGKFIRDIALGTLTSFHGVDWTYSHQATHSRWSKHSQVLVTSDILAGQSMPSCFRVPGASLALTVRYARFVIYLA